MAPWFLTCNCKHSAIRLSITARAASKYFTQGRCVRTPLSLDSKMYGRGAKVKRVEVDNKLLEVVTGAVHPKSLGRRVTCRL